MSHVSVSPDVLTTAAADLEKIGSTLDAAHLASAPRTLAMAPAAADEVSASIAQLFSQHAQAYQAAASQVAAYQDRLVQNLRTGATSYAGAESVNDLLLGGLAAIRFGPGLALFAAALLYALSLPEWIYTMPEYVQIFAFLPAGFLLVSAFLSLVAGTFLTTLIASGLGLA